MFGSEVLKIFGSDLKELLVGRRKLHNEELHNLFSLPHACSFLIVYLFLSCYFFQFYGKVDGVPSPVCCSPSPPFGRKPEVLTCSRFPVSALQIHIPQ
jgi:hypothetical protein